MGDIYGNEVRDFYNKYGINEWNRLEENTYSKINFLLHMHFIEKHLHKGMRILDAGCGQVDLVLNLPKEDAM